jgi:hypothetical protein
MSTFFTSVDPLWSMSSGDINGARVAMPPEDINGAWVAMPPVDINDDPSSPWEEVDIRRSSALHMPPTERR